MTATRTLILEYLEKRRLATAAELSRRLGRTAADVRYHLKALHADGVVESVPVESTARGRPAKAFRLSSTGRPNDLPFLASQLLQLLVEGRDETDGEPAAHHLARRYLPAPSDEMAITQRLTLLIEKLNQRHYEARWEARPTGPRITFSNCPFAPILPDHPELCRMDRSIIEQWTLMPTEQRARANPETLSPPTCIFQLSAVRRGD